MQNVSSQDVLAFWFSSAQKCRWYARDGTLRRSLTRASVSRGQHDQALSAPCMTATFTGVQLVIAPSARYM